MKNNKIVLNNINNFFLNLNNKLKTINKKYGI